jgi:hypothetical protein
VTITVDDLALFVPPALHRNRTYPLGRICQDCTTVLSRYNPGDLCAVHQRVRRSANLPSHLARA